MIALSEATWLRPDPDPLACFDCLLPYGEPGWCDTWIPSETWLKISPTGHDGGVLCLTCMARRLVFLGIDHVPLIVGSGPWNHAPTQSWRDGWAKGHSVAISEVPA